ncbi:hypothetical protein BDP81DRAFT_170249 [Colletotrichum phormii]|uniref:Uncharacterized protein n=1 Tax=Colletotrichum phormii TaxID=359342 RepID=A0AAJ0E8P2_9PEZI|nr:uncharacterized protein BDP81DRAFT_170249 [Colletotrichum phormii]KAK1621885.1 hypothetical protein BDP81DRAFT_170249 [Colletotrichum phormii]
MSGVAIGPSTPQRPSSLALDDAVDIVSSTPTRLGLLQTPPRRFSRHLKRSINAVEPEDNAGEDLEEGVPGSVRPLATPPRRPPRRARFSTGPAEPTSLDVQEPASSTDRVVPTSREASPRKEEARPEEQLAGEEQLRVEEQLGGEVHLDGLESPGEFQQLSGIEQLGELGQSGEGEKLSGDRHPGEGEEEGDSDNLEQNNSNERDSASGSVHGGDRDGKLGSEPY